MNINLTVNNIEKDIALTRKLIAVQEGDIPEDILYTAIEMGISGEPLNNDSEYDINAHGISEVMLRYDEKSASRLYSDGTKWHFEETRDMPSTLGARVYTSNSRYNYDFVKSKETLVAPQLQNIRVFPEDDGYCFRSIVTNISEIDTTTLPLLSINYFSCSDILPTSFWIRLVSMFNTAIGYRVFRYDAERKSVIAEMIDSNHSSRLLSNLYNLLGICMTPIQSTKGTTVKKIVLWRVVDELSYRIINVLAELPDIAFVLYTYSSEYQRIIKSADVQVLHP